MSAGEDVAPGKYISLPYEGVTVVAEHEETGRLKGGREEQLIREH